MRIHSSKPEDSGINVMPLIDILFTLIIFFLATATFQEEQRVERDQDIKLAQLGGRSLSSPPESLIINVTKDGKYRVQVGNVTIETQALKELEEVLKQHHNTNPNLQVIIRGDEKASFGKGSAALSASQKAGFKKQAIAWDTTAVK
jgi:biopolymer transport protein ExbD